MADPRITLKNPTVAAVLAFLLPGAGHWYQGRRFKAAIYFVGILGLFSWGSAMAEWKGVYFRWQEAERWLTPRKGNERAIGYLSQVMVGLPSLPAVVQWYRYSHTPEHPNMDSMMAELPLRSSFRGYAKINTPEETWEGPVSGTLQLRVADEAEGRPFGPEVRGQFTGVRESDGKQVELDLAGPFELSPKLAASSNVAFRLDGQSRPKEFSSSQRYVNGRVVNARAEFDSPIGQIEGTIPRRIWNWYQMPLDDDPLQDLNRRLGRKVDIALLFTWVAGLLNLLAIWDAYEGPAYGYGDEPEQPEDQPVPASSNSPAPAVAATATERK